MNLFDLKSFFKKRQNFVAFVLLLFITALVCTISYFNEIQEGGADGYWHYYFSKYAFQKPEFFLHHWGKPFFILLSAPFAQFGFYAVNFFNILCGSLSAWIAYRWCRKMNFNYAPLVVVLVFFTPLYFLVLQSALTEPLFSLLLIYSAYLIFSEKYILGAVVASCLMYSRTEGTFIILIFVLYYILVKQWKFIPLFATAFLIYSFAGFFSGHDFLWFFTENPYGVESAYGHGTWTHFFEKYNIIFGLPFLFLIITGIIALFVSMIKNKAYKNIQNPSKDLKIFILVLVPALAFFMFHVTAWAMGKFASAGLERVMACILPLLAILGMYAVNLIFNLRFVFLKTVIIIFITYHTVSAALYNIYRYPLKAYAGEKVEREAANWFKNYRQPNSVIFYAHPALIFYCDYNPFSDGNKECFAFPNENCGKELEGKSYYFWDSQFSESSCGMKLEELEKCDNLVKVKEFTEQDFNFKLVVFETK